MWTVMLVDDEPAVRDGLRDHLNWTAMGARVVASVSSGEEALELFPTLRPDIVLTDIYMPGMDGLELMQRLHAEAPDTVFVVLSGYDEFEKARRSLQVGAVDYILKPARVKEIQEVIGRAVGRCEENRLNRRLAASLPALREHFLMRLLRERPDPAEAEFLALTPLLEGPFAVALLSLERTGAISPVEWQLARLQIQEAASGAGCYPLPYPGDHIPVILHQPADPEGWSRQLLDTLQGSCPLTVTIGLSRLCAQVSEAFGQAQEALAYKAILGVSRVIPLAKVAVDGDHLLPYQPERNQALLEALRAGDEAEVRRLVGVVAASLAEAPLPYVRGVCTELYGLGVMALSERGLATEEGLSPAEFWARLTAAEDAASTFSWLEVHLGQTAARLNVRRESRHERVLQEIDELIAQRYAEELTLEEVARSVFLSRTYVAYLFKQVRGRPFLEHLTRVRMAKARELLLSTDLSVSEIAERVGYKNPVYFSRLFREYAGMMPSELRRQGH
ncbi:MAG: response regulator transcription factor [Bacillota bacterium]